MKPIPYPATTRAKGWRFELDMERVRQSDTWALAGPALRPWLMMLWAVAWEQTPCGSLPKDDELIAARLEMPLEDFRAARSKLMRGWWEADDGRLYLDTIVERVREMLERRAKDADRTARSRASRAKPHDDHDGVTRDSQVSSPPVPEPVSTSLRSVDVGAAGRGTRLPEDWEPSEADRDFCRERRPDLDIETTALVFRNFWTSKTGKAATKLSWAKTWQNWVIGQKPGPVRQHDPPKQQESFYERDLRLKRQRFYENAGLPVPNETPVMKDIIREPERIAG